MTGSKSRCLWKEFTYWTVWPPLLPVIRQCKAKGWTDVEGRSQCLQQQQHDGCNLLQHYHSVRKKQLVHDRVLGLIQLLGSRSNLHQVMDHVKQIFRQFKLTVQGNSEEIIPGVDHFPMQTKPQSNFLRHYKIRRSGNDCMESSGCYFFVFALTVIIAMWAGDTVRHEDQPCTVFEKGNAKTQTCNLAMRKDIYSGHLGCVLQMREETGELPGKPRSHQL